MSKVHFIKVLLFLYLLLPASAAYAKQHALLIGISDYSDPRIPDLEGPVNDVQALHDLLIRHWQFSAADITMLLDAQATEAAILGAIDTLHQSSTTGDDIIIYFSGHGTSAGDPDLGAYLNLPDGSGAIVTSDFDTQTLTRDSLAGKKMDGLLIGRFEIKPKLEKLDIDRNVLVIFDACFSGNAARDVSSVFQHSQRRQLDLSNILRPLHESMKLAEPTPEVSRGLTRSFFSRKKKPFPYKNTVYFGAAAEDQYAVDFSSADIKAGLVSTIDGKPHGGFTDALLRTLSMPDASVPSLSYSRLFNRIVNQFNTWCKACGHTPVSLPAANTDSKHLLERTILNANTLVAGGTNYDASKEPALQEALVVNTEQLALKSVASMSDIKALNNTTSPDIYLEQQTGGIVALAADRQTIGILPENISEQNLSQWLAGRQWLKTRMTRDLINERGNLKVDFRHPLASNRVTQGEFIHFNVISNTSARLMVMLLNAQSELSILYPINEREINDVLYAMNPRRIPHIDEPQIQVNPPWGTDTLLFYALPIDHSLDTSLEKLAQQPTIALNDPALKAIEASLDTRSLAYSAASIRVISAARP